MRLRLPHFSDREAQVLLEEVTSGAYYDFVDVECECFAGDLQVTVVSLCERSERD
jgi:hypothetical protein